MNKKKILFSAIVFVVILSILSATVVSACEEPPEPCIGNPGNAKCVGKSGEKDASFDPPTGGPGTRGRSDG